MAEIKSTLDLVMEKTRHLTFSDDEKQVQKYQEIKQRFAGIVQKFQDRILSEEGFKTELETLKQPFDIADDRLFIDELLNRVTLTRDNRMLLDLLRDHFRININDIEGLLAEFHEVLSREARRHSAELKTALAENHNISGSAAIPNLENDPRWKNMLQDVIKTFAKQLNREKERLNPS